MMSRYTEAVAASRVVIDREDVNIRRCQDRLRIMGDLVVAFQAVEDAEASGWSDDLVSRFTGACDEELITAAVGFDVIDEDSVGVLREVLGGVS